MSLDKKTVRYKNKKTGKEMLSCTEEEWKAIQENEQLAAKFQRITAADTPPEVAKNNTPPPPGPGKVE